MPTSSIPVTVDEWQDCARFSGLPLIERSRVGHALNIKAVARRFARETAANYQSLRLIVVHLGSGITVSAHRGGRMIDNNTPEEGPFGPDRTGWLPVRELIKLCFSGTVHRKATRSHGLRRGRPLCLPGHARSQGSGTAHRCRRCAGPQPFTRP